MHYVNRGCKHAGGAAYRPIVNDVGCPGEQAAVIPGGIASNIYDGPNTDVGEDFVAAEPGAECRAIASRARIERSGFIQAEVFVAVRLGLNGRGERFGHVRIGKELPGCQI